MTTALFYGSSTGNTQEVAELIAKALNEDITTIDVADEGCESISKHNKLILGISTWGEGDLQDDWEDIWGDFCDIDFNGKTVALFGLGDQDTYGDEFVDALGTLYEQVKTAGANIVGFTSSEGYEHEASKAELDGEFVGLVVDVDNQDDLTQERIDSWTNNIKTSIL